MCESEDESRPLPPRRASHLVHRGAQDEVLAVRAHEPRHETEDRDRTQLGELLETDVITPDFYLTRLRRFVDLLRLQDPSTYKLIQSHHTRTLEKLHDARDHGRQHDPPRVADHVNHATPPYDEEGLVNRHLYTCMRGSVV